MPGGPDAIDKPGWVSILREECQLRKDAKVVAAFRLAAEVLRSTKER